MEKQSSIHKKKKNRLEYTRRCGEHVRQTAESRENSSRNIRTLAQDKEAHERKIKYEMYIVQ